MVDVYEASKADMHASTPEIPSNAAILGHPIHPSMIPYPVAMLTTALITDLAYVRTRDRYWARNSRWLLLGGLVTGLAAGLVGSVDYLTIPEVQRNPKARLHAAGNILALVLTALNLAGRWNNPTAALPGNAWLTALVATLLGGTAALGGELSYRDKVGVDSTPLQDYLDGSASK